jgi:hypothetical protein
VEDVTNVEKHLEAAAAPVTQAMAGVGDLTTAMNNAAANATDAASNAVAGATDAAASAADAATSGVAGAADAVASAEGAATDAATSGVASATSGVAKPEGEVKEMKPNQTEEEHEAALAKADADIKAKQAESMAKRKQMNESQQPNASSKMQAGVGVAPTQKITAEKQGVITGGSRKRRHIHKLSRRIERTLRRVQKKYGLKDKNDFLRRTLRSTPHKDQTPHKDHKGL